MSVEEEVELRDLVAQALESNGCLAKIRAQLRASIFLALDEDAEVSKQQPLLNNKINTYLETEEGRAMFCIVREFLEFFNLYFTISVFEPESYMGNFYHYEGRQKVIKDLGLDILEDTTVPLLLQLIKIAQSKTKSIKINLNCNGIDENKSLNQEVDSMSNQKTDSDNIDSKPSNNEKFSGTITNNTSNNLGSENLNVTFDLTSPTVTLNINKKNDSNNSRNGIVDGQENPIEPVLDGTLSRRDKDDDTYEDTSSIAEDSVALINVDSSTKIGEPIVNGIDEKVLDEIANETDTSQPVVKEHKIDKPKLSPQKSEKLKSKSSLSSLSDLPPLQMNKSRVNDILPSLYSKEFKDKSNLKELDKLFDMEVEYEEDFMCSGDDLSLKSDGLKSDFSKINLLDDLSSKSPTADKGILGKRDLKQNKSPNRIISDCNKPLYKPLVSSQKSKEGIKNHSSSRSENSSNSSISENLEITTD